MQKEYDHTALQTALQRWAEAGAPLPDDIRMSRKNVGEILKKLEPKIPSMQCAVAPSSFNPKEEHLCAYPRPLGWDWPSCAGLLQHFGGKGVLSRLPLFWQVESPLYRACQAAGSFIFLNDKANMPLGAEAVRSAEIGTVLTDLDDASAFSSFLLAKNYPLPEAWLIVHVAEHIPGELPFPLANSPSKIGQEVHVLPGVPILEQCSTLSDTKKPLFHRSSGYYWETEEKHTLITGPTEDPCPLIRFELSFLLEEHDECPCGQEIVRTVTLP